MNLGSHPAWQPVSCLFVPKIADSAMILADGRFGYGLSSVYRVRVIEAAVFCARESVCIAVGARAKLWAHMAQQKLAHALAVYV